MADVAIDQALITKILLTETTTPSTPASTKWKLYVKTTGLYVVDSAGNEYQVAGSGLNVKATSPSIVINGSAGNNRALRFQTAGATRWAFIANTTSESGSDVGSDMTLNTFNDAGVFKAVVITITRSNGNVAFTGTLSKGGGSFKIDHPLDPTNKNLIHSFVEGPRADLIYRGKATLVAGKASASIDEASNMTPGTFEALTKHTEAQVWVQNEGPGWGAVRAKVIGGTVQIECQDVASTDTISWMVVAERNDKFYRWSTLTDEQGRFMVEVDKAALSPDELKQLEAIEADVTEVTTEVIPSLIGKRGYVLHPDAHELPRPMRETRPIKGKGPKK